MPSIRFPGIRPDMRVDRHVAQRGGSAAVEARREQRMVGGAPVAPRGSKP